MDKEILEKINKFTRRALNEEEVYVFSVILCDNEIDRDCERFSDEALETLKERFVGKTGIFDHDPSTSNQTARIFDTEIVTDPSKTTKNGEIYKYLKAIAYMVRTDENRSLIAEIDGGIKKEVSISCSAAKRICSICGDDKAISSCNHIKGRKYDGKLCHTVLGSITDAYEWSFVAVPVQKQTTKLTMKNRDKYILNVNAYNLMMDIKKNVKPNSNCPIGVVSGIYDTNKCQKYHVNCSKCVQKWLNDEEVNNDSGILLLKGE